MSTPFEGSGQRSRYVAECREMAGQLGSWAVRNIHVNPRAHARVAARNAFVALGLRHNCAADHEVDVREESDLIGSTIEAAALRCAFGGTEL